VLATLRGASVLLLLATFLAYLLIPLVEGIRRQLQRRHIRRPPPIWAVLLAIYSIAFAILLVSWRGSAPLVRGIITQSAPAAIERLFGNSGSRIESLYERVNQADAGLVETECPTCGTSFALDLAESNGVV